MSDGKLILVDTSRCTGCRGCQVVCKQWNVLPGTKTKQTGTYQNPPDFSAQTFKVVRFAEGTKEGLREPYWYFFSDMYRHCVNPSCLVVNELDEMIHDEETGAIVYTEGTKKLDFEMARGACPYDVPRQDPETKVMKKCTMCMDRIKNGMKPACVLSCPTAMEFATAKPSSKRRKSGWPSCKRPIPRPGRLTPTTCA